MVKAKNFAVVVILFLLGLPLVTFGGGVALIENLWEQEIASDNYEIGTGDPSHRAPIDTAFPAPEGIYGWTLKENGDSSNWSWVRARAHDDPNIKRWVHTSMWAENIFPYWSCFYCVNKNYAHMYVPMYHKYFMSAFRWIPTIIQRFPPQPVNEPPQPPNAQGAYRSGVYLTREYYAPPPNGEWSQVVDITQRFVVMW